MVELPEPAVIVTVEVPYVKVPADESQLPATLIVEDEPPASRVPVIVIFPAAVRS